MPSVPGMGRRAAKKDDVRLAHAHLTRMLANNLPPSSLADNVVGGRGWGAWQLWGGVELLQRGTVKEQPASWHLAGARLASPGSC